MKLLKDLAKFLLAFIGTVIVLIGMTIASIGLLIQGHSLATIFSDIKEQRTR